MSKKGAFGLVCVGLVLLTCFAAEAKDESGSKTVVVNCDKGDSINEALKEQADELVIKIKGWCTEDVVIERDFVTLRGTDPLKDGIEGTSPPGTSPGWPSVSIRGADNVLLESLGINGGDLALELLYSFGVDVVDCRLEGGDTWVVFAVGSRLYLSGQTVITNNLNGLQARDGSWVSCTNCVIDVPNGWGVRAHMGGRIGLESSTVNGALRIDVGGVLSVWDSDVTVASGWGLVNHGWLEWESGNLEGAILLDVGSWAAFIGVEQTSLPSRDNIVGANSTLHLFRSTLKGKTFVADFSHGTLEHSIVGDLDCYAGGDVWCDGSSTKLSSNCGLCP